MMIKIRFLMVILLCLGALKTNAVTQNMNPEQLLAAQQDGAVVIDIRTPAEWANTGTIVGAKRIMFFDQNRQPQIDAFMQSLEKIVQDNNQPVVLVCRSGNRSGVALRFLQKNKGYKNVAHLARGMNQWLAEKREVEK